ncbi:MAG: ATP-binding cassette domain-containing protein [Bombilactobacillus mellifer]|nr:ATP-binding cassette domain-containing protein [Bombilactobacillus mellifer]
MINVDKLTIGYKNIIVVADLNFELQKGHFVALIGSNGAGKSTLINTLIGINKPLKGEVTWNIESNKKNIFNDVGFNPQSQLIDWYTSVFDNVLQGPLLAGYKLGESKQFTIDALKLLDLYDLRSKAVDHISGGQQQRVQIAREIARKPKLYILDEPTTGLDIETAESLFNYLKKEVQTGATVLTSSHDLTLLEDYATQVLFINEHEQKYFGPLNTFLDEGISLREKYLKERSSK